MTRKFVAAALACAATVAWAGSAEAAGTGCDPIARGHCLLPFPNDFFTVRDAGTATGRRSTSALGMPRNTDGERDRPDRVEPRRRLQPGPADHRKGPRARHPDGARGARGSCRSPTSASLDARRSRSS